MINSMQMLKLILVSTIELLSPNVLMMYAIGDISKPLHWRVSVSALISKYICMHIAYNTLVIKYTYSAPVTCVGQVHRTFIDLLQSDKLTWGQNHSNAITQSMQITK